MQKYIYLKGRSEIAFDILPGGKSPPPGYIKSSGHLLFEVRMMLERK